MTGQDPNAPPFPDLRDDPPGWSQLIGAAPRSKVGTLVVSVARDIDTLTDSAVRRIVSYVPDYGHVDPDFHGELWWSTKRNLQSILVTLGAQRHYLPAELEPRQQVAVRALQRGLPLTALMHAFRVGYVELWEALTGTATDQGPNAMAALVRVATLVWTSLDELSSAVTDSYNQALAVQGADERRRALTFLTALRGLPATMGEAESSARALGFDPNGQFLWAACDPVVPADRQGTTLFVDMPTSSFALLAGENLTPDDEPQLAGTLQQAAGEHVGVGLVRTGLDGARLSMLDAELAHQAAIKLGHNHVLFRDEWLDCAVLSFSHELMAIIEPWLKILREEPEATKTLEAFLHSDTNLAATGRLLHVHPNTVAYRLSRFRELSSIDLRSTRGTREASALLTLRDAQ